jgi:hypothetical protein
MPITKATFANVVLVLMHRTTMPESYWVRLGHREV